MPPASLFAIDRTERPTCMIGQASHHCKARGVCSRKGGVYCVLGNWFWKGTGFRLRSRRSTLVLKVGRRLPCSGRMKSCAKKASSVAEINKLAVQTARDLLQRLAHNRGCGTTDLPYGPRKPYCLRFSVRATVGCRVGVKLIWMRSTACMQEYQWSAEFSFYAFLRYTGAAGQQEQFKV